MLVIINKEELLEFLQRDLKSWESIAGGPNFSAFEFNPKKISPEELKSLGYYENRDAWVAGVQVAKLQQYIEQVQNAETLRIS